MAVKKVPILESFSWQMPVKDKDLSSPPGSPAKGDRYIVASVGSGDWTDHSGDIALCTVGGGSPEWEFVTKTEGMICWIDDEDVCYKFDGTNWLYFNNVAIVSTDHAVARFNGVIGQIKNSGIIIDDSDNITGIANLTATGTALFNDLSNAICVEVDNDGTNHGLYIHQDGVLASSKCGLYVYSNAAQTNSVLCFMHMDNSSSTKNLLSLTQDGSGRALSIIQTLSASDCSVLIDNNSTSHGLWINQGGVLASTKSALYIFSNAVQVNYPLFTCIQQNASSTAGMFVLLNYGTGYALGIRQYGNGTHISFGGNPSNSSPEDGDLWFDGTNLKLRVGTTTYTLDKTSI